MITWYCLLMYCSSKRLSTSLLMTFKYVSLHLVPAVIMYSLHPCRNWHTWLSHVLCDVIKCPISNGKAASACLNYLFAWVTWCVCFFFFLLEYGKLVGWKPSTKQWVTAMRWISQASCAFLARQRNPVHSTHTDTANTVYGSLTGALCDHRLD